MIADLSPGEEGVATLLIVDDDAPVLFGMQEYFSACGFDVDGATEFEVAQELLKKKEYSVVIADLRLSGTNGTEGLEVVQLVRERWPNTRTILLTAYGSAEIERAAIDKGVDHVLSKPQPMRELRKVVAGLLPQM